MRVPNEILDVVCFLVTKDRQEDEIEKKCGGTAFFVSIPSAASKDRVYPYLITAKHNIVKAQEEDCELYLRINTVGNRNADILIGSPWVFPEDPSVDLLFCLSRLLSRELRWEINNNFGYLFERVAHSSLFLT